MNKKKFFLYLKNSLAIKYGLKSTHIDTIRCLTVGKHAMKNPSLKALCFYLVHLKENPKNKRKYTRIHYQQLINFLASCKEEAYLDITQITKFDRDRAPGQ